MTHSRTVIEIFLSSPDEVEAERELIAQYAAEWNRLRGRETSCHLSILTWQEFVAPALGSRSQEVVNHQIGADYDVYLSIFWTRIGTPTGVADSGTVEECELALERAKEGGRPRIAALFKKAPIDPSTIDPTQLQKVQSFKKRLGEEGAFYREFSDEDSLRNIVNLLFEQLAKNTMNGGTKRPKMTPSAGNDAAASEADDDEELGLLEVGERFQELSSVLVERLQDIADEEVKTTETLKSCTQEISDLSALGRLDADAAKAILRRSTEGFRALSDHYERSLDKVDDLFSEMNHLVEADVRLRLEFDDPKEAAGDNIAAMSELAITLTSSIAQMDELITSTRQLPPLSADLRKARNRLGKHRERLKQMLVSLKETTESSVAFFEERSRRPN